MAKEDQDRLWETAIREARGLSKGYFKGNQMKVAEIALSVCDPGDGGRKDSRFSLANFARALEIVPQTLYHWCQVYRDVYSHLTDTHKRKFKIKQLEHVYRATGPKAKKDDVRRAAREEEAIDPRIYKWRAYKSNIKSVVHNFEKPILLMDIPDNMIEDVYKLASLLKNLCEKELQFRAEGTTTAEQRAQAAIDRVKGGIEAAKKLS